MTPDQAIEQARDMVTKMDQALATMKESERIYLKCIEQWKANYHDAKKYSEELQASLDSMRTWAAFGWAAAVGMFVWMVVK